MSFSNTSVGDKPADPYKKANEEEVELKTKVDDLVEFITSTKFAMMTTHEVASDNLVSRCMALAATESGGVDLLFHTNTESGKTNDLSADPNVNISFINASGQWASISGPATVVTDREFVKKYYSPPLKAWLGDLGDGVHDGSANDPRIGVIRVKMYTATYTLVAKGIIGRIGQIAQGTVTGAPAQVNCMRDISQEEAQAWRASQEDYCG